jgi:hypothetical protein
MNRYEELKASIAGGEAVSPELQRIKIAEACGWTVSAKGWWSHPTLPCNGGAEPSPPDYDSDLNAMHEAEKVLNKVQGRRYHENLCEVLRIGEKWPDGVRLISATAAQRAEAFLRTLNLWEDTP